MTLVLRVSLAVAYLVFMVATLAADGRTTSANLVPQDVHRFITLPGGDTVYNWDYFADNATINKVKHRIDGVSNDPYISPLLPTSGTAKFAHITDNNYPDEDWDKDSGKKNAVALWLELGTRPFLRQRAQRLQPESHSWTLHRRDHTQGQ